MFIFDMVRKSTERLCFTLHSMRDGRHFDNEISNIRTIHSEGTSGLRRAGVPVLYNKLVQKLSKTKQRRKDYISYNYSAT